MIRRLQITLLALFVSVWAMASETSVKNADGVEIWYDFDSSAKTASVTYRGDNYESYSDEYTGEVVIPSKVTYEGEEYSVTSIGDDAFYNCDALTSITIPKGLTEIGEWAFAGCSSLTSIDVALDNNSYTSIDGVLFSKDKTILIKYPEGKKDATPYIIPESVTSIGEHAFRDCNSLTSITIPESVKEIGNSAFEDCSSLTSITILESVTEIGYCAFRSCYKLYEVYNKSNLTITAGSFENGYVARYAKKVYTDDSGESKLKTVGDYIFYVDGEDIELIAYTGSETSITLPSDYEGKNYNIGGYAFYNCDALTSITLPEGLTTTGEWTFFDCDVLTSITLPESLTSIGDNAFSYCSSLTSITLPESVTSIGDNAFGCSSLTTITLPEGLTKIGDYAFRDCSSLTSITIPESVTEIGENAFYVCSSLTSIDVASNNNNYTSIDGVLFSKDKTILIKYPEGKEATLYIIPESVTKIEFCGFDGCSTLTSITIPEEMTEIREFAFCGCSSLTSIMLPDGVTSIGFYAFYGCSSLTSITLPKGMTEIGFCAFEDCSSLTSITLPESVTSIGSAAF